MLYDKRVNEVDLRLARNFSPGKLRVRGIADSIMSSTSGRPGMSTTYGPSWLLPTAILGGRLFKFGSQVEF